MQRLRLALAQQLTPSKGSSASLFPVLLLRQLRRLLDDGGEAWAGFVAGALWSRGSYSIEDLYDTKEEEDNHEAE